MLTLSIANESQATLWMNNVFGRREAQLRIESNNEGPLESDCLVRPAPRTSAMYIRLGPSESVAHEIAIDDCYSGQIRAGQRLKVRVNWKDPEEDPPPPPIGALAVDWGVRSSFVGIEILGSEETCEL